MLRKVVCLVLPGTAPFEFGVVCEVFGVDRSDTGAPEFDFSIATADPGPVPLSAAAVPLRILLSGRITAAIHRDKRGHSQTRNQQHNHRFHGVCPQM